VNIQETKRFASAACLLLVAAATTPAHALRPFDGTDADVAGPREFELEFGPAQYLREGGNKGVLAPAVVANFGIQHDREIVVEGKLKRLFSAEPGEARTSLVDTALSLKQVHRRGGMQDESGPSVASECSWLLPTIHGGSGSGLACAAIVSQRWAAATLHLNGLVGRTRDHEWNRFVGLIAEGPHAWIVRPVAEIFDERDTGGSHVTSALVGAVWHQREKLSFDFGVRFARTNGPSAMEVRAGLTAAF
jgi:hypothetical protein